MEDAKLVCCHLIWVMTPLAITADTATMAPPLLLSYSKSRNIFALIFISIFISMHTHPSMAKWNQQSQLPTTESNTNENSTIDSAIHHRRWERNSDFIKNDKWQLKMILFLSVKHTINNVIIRYIVYDDICLMVRKINYFIFILFILYSWETYIHSLADVTYSDPLWDPDLQCVYYMKQKMHHHSTHETKEMW